MLSFSSFAFIDKLYNTQPYRIQLHLKCTSSLKKKEKDRENGCTPFELGNRWKYYYVSHKAQIWDPTS